MNAKATPRVSAHAMSETYRTLFLVTLEQRSAMSLGGREDEDDAIVDMSFARDGLGRPVIKGRTLAGALIAIARTFMEVPEAISRDRSSTCRDPSLWEVWNAHLETAGTGDDAELVSGVGLRQETRTASSGAYYDAETLPAGLRWRFILEVRHPPSGEQGRQAAEMAARALQEWSRGRCWLGRRVARGWGHLRVAGCSVVELPRTGQAVDAWPNSELEAIEGAWQFLRERSEDVGATVCAADGALGVFLGKHGQVMQKPRRAYVRWPLTARAGEYRVRQGQAEETSYGLDALSMGGHHGSRHELADFMPNIARAREQPEASYLSSTSPDRWIALDGRTGADGSLVHGPALRGSGIAGALRHDLSRRLRRSLPDQPVRDPASGESWPRRDGAASADDPVAALMGIVSPADADIRHSRLIIGNGELASSDWTMAVLEKVALDGFTQGVFGSGKFDRMAVLRGTWTLDIVLEVDLQPEVEEARAIEAARPDVLRVNRMIKLLEQRRLAVGGGEFRGYGHIGFEAGEVSWALAGRDWTRWPPASGLDASAGQAPNPEVAA